MARQEILFVFQSTENPRLLSKPKKMIICSHASMEAGRIKPLPAWAFSPSIPITSQPRRDWFLGFLFEANITSFLRLSTGHKTYASEPSHKMEVSLAGHRASDEPSLGEGSRNFSTDKVGYVVPVVS